MCKIDETCNWKAPVLKLREKRITIHIYYTCVCAIIDTLCSLPYVKNFIFEIKNNNKMK